MRPPPALVGLVAGLVLLVGIGSVTRSPSSRAPAAVTTPVVGAALVCPAVRRTDAEQLDTRVSAGTVRQDGPVELGATVSSQPLGAPGGPDRLPLRAAGEVVTGLRGELTDGALVLRARGVLAAGLQAEQLTRAATGDRRGYEGLLCTGPQTDSWFAGGSLGPGESSVLLLANPDDTPAVIDVQVWTAAGPVDPRPGRGLVVPAGARTAVPLDTLAPAGTGLALHVTAARGRVAAAVEHTRVDGGTALGAEWVPPSPPPAGRVVVPGLPGRAAERALFVTNPGLDPTAVSVQVTGADGQFVPTGLDALPVPAGTTVRVDLSPVLAASPGAVAVTSAAGPVLAVGLVVAGQGPVKDFAYAGAAGPLDGAALVPDAAGDASVLLLSALDGGATVVVTPLPVVGVAGPPPAAQTVPVAGGSTVALPLSAFGVPAGGPLAIEVRPAPGSGPVFGAALLREDLPDGPLVTLLTLAAPPLRVTRPVVAADPGAALP